MDGRIGTSSHDDSGAVFDLHLEGDLAGNHRVETERRRQHGGVDRTAPSGKASLSGLGTGLTHPVGSYDGSAVVFYMAEDEQLDMRTAGDFL